MIRKILILSIVFVLLTVSAAPALAEKPPQAKGEGNPTHENNGKGIGVNKDVGKPEAVSPGVAVGNPFTINNSSVNKLNGNEEKGFDNFGYNRNAGIFNGTGLSWCMEKLKLGEDGCRTYMDPYANDRLIMKWNAEWDRGNYEGWTDDSYDAWLNNNWNGRVEGGSGEVWHYKIVWVGNCVADPDLVPDGGYCEWGQFAVILDHGSDADRVHEFLAHAKPAGYGTYP